MRAILPTFFLCLGTSGCGSWQGNEAPSPSPQGPGGGGGASYGGSDSYIVVDWNYGKILAEHNADRKRPVAGMAQVATALVTLDWMEAGGIDKNTAITIPGSARAFGRANPLGLQPGDRMTVRDALFSMMLARDPVAADALALYFGWQMSPRAGGRNGMTVFVEQMNALAESLGMSRTKFENAHGLSVMGKPGYSTARDLARLASYGQRNPRFNFYTSQSSRTIAVHRGGQRLTFRVKNANRMLGSGGVDGMKTGDSPEAGQCVILSSRRNDRFIPLDENRSRRIPYRLIVVELGSGDPYNRASILIDQGWREYEAWVQGGMVIQDTSQLLNPPEE